MKSGLCLYDNSVDLPVDIVGLDYDFWYEIGRADGMLEPGEEPAAPDASGLLYYVRFRRAGDVPFSVVAPPRDTDFDGAHIAGRS